LNTHFASGPLRRALTLSALAVALSGCAAQMAYRDGRELVDKDQVEAGLLKFQEAIQQDPGNAQYRAAFASQRELVINRWLAEAERLRAAGTYEHARALYANAEGLEHLRAALAVGDPDPGSLHAAIGDLQTLQGEYAAALYCHKCYRAVGILAGTGKEA